MEEKIIRNHEAAPWIESVAPRDNVPGPEEVLRAYRERLGRAGGLARAKKLSPERRTEIAKQAGLAKRKKP